MVNDSADVTSSGRSFHVCGPAIGKARLPTVYGLFPDGYFPGWLLPRMVFFPERRFPESRFPDRTFPGWSLSRKDISRVVIFPDETISYD